MPTSLTATKIKDTYGQLLHVDGGVTSTLKTVYDGDGTATALSISTAGIAGNLTGNVTGNVSGNAGTVTNGVYTTGDQTIAGTKTFSSNPVYSAGTANGVAYLNGSKVLTTGSALTFDGTSVFNLTRNGGVAITQVTSDNQPLVRVNNTAGAVTDVQALSSYGELRTATNHPLVFSINSAEQMRLTSTGLGIGTSSPDVKLTVSTSAGTTPNATEAAVKLISTATAAVGTGPSLVFRGNTGNTTTVYNFAGIQGYKSSSTAGDYSGSLGFFVQNSGGGVNLTKVATLDSSGNLGLGVTPSAWGTYKAFQNGGTSVADYGSANNTIFGSNMYYDGSGFKYIASGNAASSYRMYSGKHEWNISPSGTAGNAISFTQAMTLDASGNLGIGTSSPDVFSRGESRTLGVSGSGGVSIGINAATGNDPYLYLGVNNTRTVQLLGSATEPGLYSATSLPLLFGTNFTERMRIDSSGNLLVGTTSAINVSSGNVTGGQISPSGVLIASNSGGVPAYIKRYTSTGVLVSLFYGTTERGTITTDGSTVAYNTSSDYRLKENIQPMQNALATVAQLKPVTYTWKESRSNGQGFIAHELQAVVPDCVTGEKDAVDEEGNPVYQGIDTSFLVATLTKAIQEQQDQINQLKAEVAALKGN